MVGDSSRGRLTPVDIVFYGVAVMLLGFMAKPVYTVLTDSSMGTGATYLFQLVFPSLIITIMVVVFLTGATGGTVK